MKTKLRLLYYSFMIACMLLISGTANSQINFSANFDIDAADWTGTGIGTTIQSPCQGAGAIRTNLYYDALYGIAFSPNIGTSNGGVVTLNYQYKVLEYGNPPTVATPNSEDWGLIQVYWAIDPNGPYTLLETIDPTNHIESTSCAQRSVAFSPPLGNNVYLAFYAEITNVFGSDFYVYFDEINAVQAAPVACTGMPAENTIVATDTNLCDGQSTTLSLDPGYFNSGLTFQWQSSSDNVNYANVPGATGVTYTAIQSSSTWYRLIITCPASSESTTLMPIQITSSGLACLCDVTFEGAIEPVTYVDFAGIENSSASDVDYNVPLSGVQDFTTLPPGEVTAGQSYTMTLGGNTNGNYNNNFTVFIDWNQDGDFSDVSEIYEIASILTNSNGNDNIQVTGQIAVPDDALEGLTYMRIMKLYNSYTADHCSSDAGVGYGEVEDYLLNVTSATSPAEISWVNLQHPPTMTISAGGSDIVYARVYAEGVTEAAGAGAGITAWIGISPEGSNTNPNTWTTWVPATFNVQADNNDEYMAAIGTGLVPGTYYYASRFQLDGGDFSYGGFNATGGGYWDGAANVSGVLTVTCGTMAPTADAVQTFCQSATVANLEADGDTIKWYSAATGGTALAETVALADDTTYYASVTPDGGCESAARTPVAVDITMTPAPTTDAATQTFCNEADLSDLDVDGNGEIVWYAAGMGGTALAETTGLEDGVMYYASQVIDGCESAGRTAVTAEIIVTDMPSGDQMQQIEESTGNEATIEDIMVTATGNIKWYATAEDAADGENALAPGTEITSGTYYATQTIDGCESLGYAVTVDIILGNGEFSAASFTYHPNPVNDVLTVSYNKTISEIEVYNIVGQKVIAKTIDQNQAQVDMSQLAAGTYMVKVMSDTASKTIKVIKQ